MSISTLSEKAREICSKYWSEYPKDYHDKRLSGLPKPSCCQGCPLYGPCNAGYPTSFQGISDRANAMNEKAASL